MKYIACNEPKHLILSEKEAPKEESGHALLKVKKIGVCGTDLHAYLGNQAFFKYPRILGHELATEVIKIGSNKEGIGEGDKVILMPYINCGICAACKAGQTNCCSKLQVFGVHIDGGMQEVISFPNRLLLPANDLSFEQIAVVEPLSIGAHSVRRAAIKKDEVVVVIGCGPIGIGIIQLCKVKGATVIVVDVKQYRLNLVQENFGADHVVNALEDPIAEVNKITNGQFADVVIDASGSKQGIESGVDYMRHGGKFVIVGLYKGELSFMHPKIHAKETSLLCSRNATLDDFVYVKELLKNDKLNLKDYITYKADFEEVVTGFDEWIDPNTQQIKVMVDMP